MIAKFALKNLMLEKEIREKVIIILEEMLNLKTKDTLNILTKKQIAEWDSLKHIAIVSELESSFDIQFEPEEIGEMINSDVIVNLIIKYL